MSRKLKKMLRRILIGFALFIGVVIVEKLALSIPLWGMIILYLIPYFVIGQPVLLKAWKNLSHGKVFDENFLMLIATIGAFLIGEYEEAVAVMLFYQVGEFFQAYAVGKSRKSIAALMDLRPDSATVIRDGEEIEVEPDEVSIGEVIVVKPGEKIPLDGVIMEGNCSVDSSALTGESLPRDLMPGDSILSGCVNLSGVIQIKVEKEFGDSSVAKILDLVENAGNKKAKTENFISKFAKYYTPVVVILAAMLAIIPSIITGDIAKWVYRALSFLVISCPCALVISIPLSFFGGLGGASKKGILVKGSNYLELLARVKTVVMDKTGTITKGNFKVSTIVSREEKVSKEQLLELAAYVEYYSNHPVSKSIVEAYGKEVDRNRIDEAEETAGFGMKAKVDGKTYFAGNAKWLKERKNFVETKEIGSIVYIASDDEYLGYLVIEDEMKPDSVNALKEMRKQGVKNLVMLTGDREEVAENVAKQAGVNQYFANLLPIDKVERLEEILNESKENEKVIFVGDGINDAPVLARADVGVAMGGLGSDAAIEAADIVIMTDELSKIPLAMQIAKKTIGIANQNIVFAIGIKVVVLILASMGIANMWAAVFADVGVAVLAILNAMRAANVK